MQVSIIRVGNSKGIRFSKTVLEKYNIQENDTLEMELESDKIVLRPKSKSPREGWAEAFKKAIASGDLPERDMFEGITNKFDEDEWTW